MWTESGHNVALSKVFRARVYDMGTVGPVCLRLCSATQSCLAL